MSSTAAVNDHHLDRIAVEAQADLTIVGGRHRDTTRAEVVRRTVWFGLTALTHHGLEHLVPEPRYVDMTADSITINVQPEHRQFWVDSIHVDDHEVVDSAMSGQLRYVAVGRLPDSGVRVRVISSHGVDEDVDLYVGEARS